MYAIKLKRTGGLMRCSDGRIYTFETRDEAEKAAKLCYQSQKVYEIVKVEGSGLTTGGEKSVYKS
jgi:hypothetical protein